MGIIQFALLYQAKTTLNHAVFLAARVSNGQMGSLNPFAETGIRQGLASGLAPLFAHATTSAELAKSRASAFAEVINPLITKIDVISPTTAMINDFGMARLDGKPGREIPNDSLQYRSPKPGASSQVSIQDANLLKLQVTYCARMIVPIANRALYQLLNGLPGFWNPGNDAQGSLTRCAIFGDDNTFRTPITADYIVRMQSP